MKFDFKKFSGSGMTSDVARNRLVSRIQEHGVNNKSIRSYEINSKTCIC